MKLNEKLIKLRKEKGLSQEEFGNEINVSRQAVSKWENEESTPDIDKIRDIANKFNVSYDYLLNDTYELDQNTTKIREATPKKHQNKLLLKTIFILFLFYLLICLYKFIAFYRFYLIANSFSEENYALSQDFKTSQPNNHISFHTTKVGNKIIEKSYFPEESKSLKDENGMNLPFQIDFTDIDKKISYSLNYDENTNQYVYHDRKEDMINDEEIESLFIDDNKIKSITLSSIPSGFKEILFASLDPRYYYVSILNRQFKVISFANDLKMRVQLNDDYLVENIKQELKYNGTSSITFSYDYVPEHFSKIVDPREKGEYPILSIEQ